MFRILISLTPAMHASSLFATDHHSLAARLGSLKTRDAYIDAASAGGLHQSEMASYRRTHLPVRKIDRAKST
jgi:hypothetical protein